MKTFSATVTLIALAAAAIFTQLHCKADDDYPTCDYCPKPTRCNAFAECACPSQDQTLDTESVFCLNEGAYYIAYLEENILLGTDTFALHAGLLPEEGAGSFGQLFSLPFETGDKRYTNVALIYKDAVYSENTMKFQKTAYPSATLEKTPDGYRFSSSNFNLPYRPAVNSILNGRPVQIRLNTTFAIPGQEEIAGTLRWVAIDDTTGTDVVPPLPFVLVKKVVPAP